MNYPLTKRILLAAACFFGGAAVLAASPNTSLTPVPAQQSSIAGQAMVLGAARAGARLVSVGDRGVVMLSDDGGANYRQAASVPISSTLTSVSFVDAKRGWAVGHWGAILSTSDGGEHWAQQRLDVQNDRPLFSVHFFDAKQGVAVGLWSLVLTTDDGGKTWVQQELVPPVGASRADANLLHLFADRKGRLYAAAERGFVLSSDDRGHTWRYMSTGYKGSFWSGLALDDGSLLVGGQRGSVYRSQDEGRNWRRIDLGGAKGSITGFAARADKVLVVGLDGLQGQSTDGGAHFKMTQREDRLPVTFILSSGQASDEWLLWSRQGALRCKPLLPGEAAGWTC